MRHIAEYNESNAMADPETLTLLIKTYQSELLAYANFLLADRQEAEDMVQQGFLALFQYGHERVANHRAWLYKTVRNCCISLRRKQKRMLCVASVPEEPGAFAASAGEELQKSEEIRIMRAAIDALPEKHREIVILKYMQNLSYQQISEITGVSPSHVGVILFESIRKLRKNNSREFIS